MAGDVTRLYRVKFTVEDKSAAGLTSIKNALVGINLETDSAITQSREFGKSLASLRGQTRVLDSIDSAFKRITISARNATGSLDDVRLAAGALGNQSHAVDGLRTSIVGAQRSSYGFKKNLEEANLALVALNGQAPALAGTSVALTGLGVAGGAAKTPLAGLGGSMAKMVAGLTAFSIASTAAHAFGDAMRDAREYAAKSADEVFRVRDGLRELANLQGKGFVGDAEVRQAMEFRKASGMSEKEANDFNQQFRGSLPLATDTKNITETMGVDVAKEVARSARRVGLSGETAGDLAGSIGMFGKIESKRQGVGQIQQIIDQLNDGRGNLTPLVKEVMKGGFATVGKGNAFRSIAERAAGISLTTGMVGNAGQASTALDAAIRGLTGFTKSQGETLSKYGVESGQDLPTMLDKIAPLIVEAEAAGKNSSAVMAEAGFGNKTDRNAIIGLVKNRKILRDKIEGVREADGSTAKADAAGQRAERLNAEFYQNDKGAANARAEANVDAATVERGMQNEDLTIARKNARADLVREKKLETVSSGVEIKLRNIVGVSALSGADYEQDLVDARVRENQEKEAKRLNVPYRRAGLAYDSGTKTQNELDQNAAAIRAAGGDPLGGATPAAELIGPPKEAAGGKVEAAVLKVVEVLERIEQKRPELGMPGGGGGVQSWRA